MSHTAARPSESLSSLISEIQAIVAQGAGEHETTEEVAKRLRASLQTGLDIPEPATRPDPERYVMYPLHVAADGTFSIASAVWNVGQSTPIHDHGTWGVVGIYSGAEAEERFAPPVAEGEPPVPLDTATWQPGAVTVCCTTDQDLHRVSCATAEPCVGIHVYGADIGTLPRKYYDESTGEVGSFVSSWAALGPGEEATASNG